MPPPRTSENHDSFPGLYLKRGSGGKGVPPSEFWSPPKKNCVPSREPAPEVPEEILRGPKGSEKKFSPIT